MPDKSETDDFKIWLGEDGILCLIWEPDTNITLDMVKNVSNHIQSIAKGKTYPFLVLLDKTKGMDREAREFILNQDDYKAAAIIGISPVARVVGNMIIGFNNKSSAPTRMFADEVNARQWLEEFKT